MADQTKIEWTDTTWNPLTGCSKISPGCDNCYAMTFAERFRGTPGHYFENGFDLQLRPERLMEPLRWKEPRLVFVNSMSDLFQPAVPTDFVRRVFSVMEQASRHTFQVLTKRGLSMQRFMQEYCGDRDPPPNVWLGVSVENRNARVRIRHLHQTKASLRFLSVEPLLEDLGDLDLSGIDWVIVGGESGARARPMNPAWALRVRDQCIEQGVPFFFKQWGTWSAEGKRGSVSANGRLLDGRVWDDMPPVQLRIG